MIRLAFSVTSVITLLLLSACPPEPMPTTTMLTPPAAACRVDAMPVPTYMCGSFTAGEYACVICPGQLGCYDALDAVYCVTTCSDPLCSVP